MIDSQLLSSDCLIKVKLLQRDGLTENCYARGVLIQLWEILSILKFKPNSKNDNYTKSLQELWRGAGTLCTPEEIEPEDVSDCSRDTSLTPVEILEKVNESIFILESFRKDSGCKEECRDLYDKCSENQHTLKKDPQCACPSPASPSLSGTTTQKSLNDLSEIAPRKSSSYASSVSFTTTSVTEYMSNTYSQKLQQSSLGIEMSTLMVTDTPAEAQPLTTIVDSVHVSTTEQIDASPEPPHNSLDIPVTHVEFPKGVTESVSSMTEPQTQPYPQYFNTENTSAHVSDATISPHSTEMLSTTDSSKLNGELTLITEAILGEVVESTTEPDVVSQSTVSDYSELSTEPGIDSSSSIVTKMRRSVESLGGSSGEFVTTHVQTALSSDDSATTPSHLTSFHSSILPIVELHQTGPQEKVTKERNLGWASSYLLSSLTTKSTSSGHEKFSSVSRVQSTLSETSQHSEVTVHEAGYLSNNQKQQEQNVAAFTSEDREDKVADPRHDSNVLPIIETELQNDGRKKEHTQSNLYLFILPSVVAIILLCGLLYTLHRYRILNRQLNRQQDLALPEQRPLNNVLEEV
ncbi:uncharacterized protein [Hyperolius riggenbachi]